MPINAPDLLTILPLIVVVSFACLLLIVGLFLPEDRRWVNPLLAAVGLLAALVITLVQQAPAARGGDSPQAFSGMIVVDGFGIFLNVLFLVSGLVGVALAYDYLKRMNLNRNEYYVLLLFSISGMMLMSQAADLIIVFLALELLSFPLYVLSGFARPRPESEEAGLKYFLLGAFSTGFVVYGIALVFGATGATAIAGMDFDSSQNTADRARGLNGAALGLIGLRVKGGTAAYRSW